ncbi:tyrosine-type recombinase/integrase [Roseovarius sp.]|uniref:tyrosine-type recombinase/integrase n=1 Tax=Roseovarius sp. TaxID=1486281 RepID=UPI003B591858
MPRYLQKRRRRWYAVLEIPNDLQERLGKARFMKSLGTESLTEAERLVMGQIARWKAEIEALRTGSDVPLETLAEEWRQDYAKADMKERDTYDEVLEDKVRDIHYEDPAKAETFHKVVKGDTTFLNAHLEEWLSGLDNTPKTIDMKRSDVRRFVTDFPYSHQISKKSVQRWAHQFQEKEELKIRTVRRIISACKGYWSYLDRAGHIDRDDEPFHDVLEKRAKASKASKVQSYKPFSTEEVVQVLRKAEEDSEVQLYDLIQLGMWTGCRIAELCHLRTDDVLDDRFTIQDAKSEAGQRTVPIHPKLAQLMSDLCASSTDGYVLSGLTRNKYEDRSNAIGKRFGRMKAQLGFGPEHAFHSIRKTVTTQLENAGVPESVSADIVGHEKQTITYGLYSGGSSFELKRSAVEKLEYPL